MVSGREVGPFLTFRLGPSVVEGKLVPLYTLELNCLAGSWIFEEWLFSLHFQYLVSLEEKLVSFGRRAAFEIFLSRLGPESLTGWIRCVVEGKLVPIFIYLVTFLEGICSLSRNLCV